MRQQCLATDNYYHILNRSIAKFNIFNNDIEFQRILDTFVYYRQLNPPLRFSWFYEQSKKKLIDQIDNDNLVDILCYCLMPTHFHLILKQNIDDGISKYMSKVENSYTRYFNIKHKRKGPLWESRFKNILVETDEQMLHLTRYIHLNPVSAGIVSKPQYWQFSSYHEYIDKKIKADNFKISNYEDVIDIQPKIYKDFVNERIDDQKDLSIIKKYLLENYTG